MSSYNFKDNLTIDNNNDGPSTIMPDQIQATTFQTGDNYLWRYVATIPHSVYSKFSTPQYVPVFPNNFHPSGNSSMKRRDFGK